MTGNAAALWPRRSGQVLGVIELHIEALFESARKSLPRRVGAVHTRVTNRAHRRVGRAELGSVAAEAILVTGEAGLS